MMNEDELEANKQRVLEWFKEGTKGDLNVMLAFDDLTSGCGFTRDEARQVVDALKEDGFFRDGARDGIYLTWYGLARVNEEEWCGALRSSCRDVPSHPSHERQRRPVLR